MRERSGRQDVTERKRPEGLARLASAANATNESGGEAGMRVGSGGVRGWARAAELAERERASNSAEAWLKGWSAAPAAPADDAAVQICLRPIRRAFCVSDSRRNSGTWFGRGKVN